MPSLIEQSTLGSFSNFSDSCAFSLENNSRRAMDKAYDEMSSLSYDSRITTARTKYTIHFLS